MLKLTVSSGNSKAAISIDALARGTLPKLKLALWYRRTH